MAKGVRRFAHNRKTNLVCIICGKEFWWSKRPNTAKCCSGKCKAVKRSCTNVYNKARKEPERYKIIYSYLAKKMGWLVDSKIEV